MSVSRPEDIIDAGDTGEDHLVTGFEDADCPGVLSTTEFESGMGPMPDPFNVAPMNLDSPQAPSSPIPTFLAESLHSDPHGYLRETSHAHNVESISPTLEALLPAVSGPAHQSVVSSVGHQLTHPMDHYVPPMHNVLPPAYHAASPIEYTASPIYPSVSPHVPLPPLPNMMADVLHPMEVPHGHYTSQFVAPPELHASSNLYRFDYCGLGVMHAPGQPPRRIDGGPEQHVVSESDSAAVNASLQGLMKKSDDRSDMVKKTRGVKKGRRARGQRKRPLHPSGFCHICLRRSERVKVVTCSNFVYKTCRKVVCQKCFEEFQWDWAAACNPLTNWTCTHCRQVCPGRAQCHIYIRTNHRRHNALMLKKAQKEHQAGKRKGGNEGNEDNEGKEDNESKEGKEDKEPDATGTELVLMQDLPPIPFLGEGLDSGEHAFSPVGFSS